ncbi:protein kinase, partial [Spirillospora sp. NPDC127506]
MDPGFRLDGRYRMERRVGRRGAAEVWRARDELLARRVAVALAGVGRSAGAPRRRLRDAARAAAALAHPNIVTTYDYGEADGPGGDPLVYVVTEYLTGEPLAARLERGLPCAQEAAAVCAQVADALAAVHTCGVVHGDLSPAQVFLTEDGVKLLGLGVTGAADRARDEAAGETRGDAGDEAGGETGDGAEDGAGDEAGAGDRDDEAGKAADVFAFGELLAACLPPPGAPPDAPPGGAAVLVDDDRHVRLPGLHLPQQL